MEEIAGEHTPLRFLQNVLHDEEEACCLRALHEQVMQVSSGFGKEEALLLLLALLSERCGQIAACSIPSCTDEVKAVCAFMERHYAEHISLEQLCRCVGLSKSTLLRAFAREKGMMPYRYLEISASEGRKNCSNGACRRAKQRCARDIPTRAISPTTSAAFLACRRAFTGKCSAAGKRARADRSAICRKEEKHGYHE